MRSCGEIDSSDAPVMTCAPPTNSALAPQSPSTSAATEVEVVLTALPPVPMVTVTEGAVTLKVAVPLVRSVSTRRLSSSVVCSLPVTFITASKSPRVAVPAVLSTPSPAMLRSSPRVLPSARVKCRSLPLIRPLLRKPTPLLSEDSRLLPVRVTMPALEVSAMPPVMLKSRLASTVACARAAICTGRVEGTMLLASKSTLAL